VDPLGSRIDPILSGSKWVTKVFLTAGLTLSQADSLTAGDINRWQKFEFHVSPR
jgi:hypothetical protein